MKNVIKLDSLNNAPLQTLPFPYFKVEESIYPDDIKGIINSFPDIADGGSYNVDDVELNEPFKSLIESIDSPEFRRIICEKFDVQVMDLPMMITLRGYSRQKDGRIHTDSKTKVATILIYLNEKWEADTGKLRILRNGHDMNDYVDEISPGPGALLAFKVTDNCWHGYPAFEGKRQSIQINFLTSAAAGNKHRFFHRLSAKLKRLISRRN
ncbi:MAG: 2OG-Fe(II) oxygenase [Pseudomonadota bacterium]|uniref:2OG-Fe(II) oxygenase n=1 Tax=Methylophaga TaxID=40222 RepID=UPI0024E1C0B3|nr:MULTISPECIES: 2OG-Fe(II) oxygenase [Methylophaga]MEC9412130.1 2OG-Fe(II) oxygenase [Pseudomonadota bacterium]WVI86576.1 2OG-Fe(II) oxygenase [Methylophaga thalassica]